VTDTHTVTIQRADGDVTITCPPWCTGELHNSGEMRAEITHTGPDDVLTVDTSHGPAALLVVALEQRPFTDRPPGTGVFMNVTIDGDNFGYDVAGLERLAEQLVGIAAQVRVKARELAALEDGTAP
jgi:hypothetical protein